MIAELGRQVAWDLTMGLGCGSGSQCGQVSLTVSQLCGVLTRVDSRSECSSYSSDSNHDQIELKGKHPLAVPFQDPREVWQGPRPV